MHKKKKTLKRFEFLNARKTYSNTADLTTPKAATMWNDQLATRMMNAWNAIHHLALVESFIHSVIHFFFDITVMQHHTLSTH